MRILSVTQSYAPFYEFGGPPVKVEALATGLAARGHQVTVLTADWGLESRLTQQRETVPARRSSFGWTREVQGVQSVYLPTWVRYRALSWNPAVRQFCEARLKEFDVAHIFGLYDVLGPAVARACKKRNIAYVVEPIGMFVPIVRNIVLKQMYRATLGKRLLDGAAAIVATSEQEAAELARGGIPREKIALRRNGVMAPKILPQRGQFRARHAIPADALLILFLGRLSAKKSPGLLLDAFKRLPAMIASRPVWLAFAGPDEAGMQNQLEGQAAASRVRERVVFTGAALADEKWAAYCDADVFVLPSQNENFGNTALEAAACGTPVVITEACGVAPLLADTGGIVVAHETEALATAVQQILSDGKLRAELSAGGKAVAAKLGWSEPVEAMERLYEKLAVRRPAIGQSAERF